MTHKLVQHNITNGLQVGGFISLSSYTMKRSRIMAAFFSHKPYATVQIIIFTYIRCVKNMFICQIIKTLQHIIHITNFYINLLMF